jgi:hypothetical protein
MGKTCYVCGINYLTVEENFNKNSRLKDGCERFCKICSRERYKRQYQIHKDKIKEQNNKYYHENPEIYINYRKNNVEKLNEKQRAYNKIHKQDVLSKKKIYRETNREKILECKRRYRQDNPEKIKQYRKDHADKFLIYTTNRRAIKAGLPSNYTANTWENAVLHFNGECAYCGRKTKLTQDHFIPVSNSGEYTRNNILPVCGSCNPSKSKNNFFEWYPKQKFYSQKRERKILRYLNYDPNTKCQQLALLI